MRSITHKLLSSAEFCRRVADWSIYNTFMLTYDATPKRGISNLPHGESKPSIVTNEQVRRYNFNQIVKERK